MAADSAPTLQAGRFRIWVPLAGVTLIVLGASLWLASSFGSPLPYEDQWIGEWQTVIEPRLEGRFGIEDLWRPHNEHRIVPTRALTLALFEATDSWDPMLEAQASCLLLALLAAVVMAALGGACSGTHRPWILAAVAVAFGVLFAWENRLSGFHTQFTFALLFGFLAVWGLSLYRPRQLRWWIGAAASFAAVISLASGLLAPLAVIPWRLLRLIKEGRCGHVATVICAATAVALGIWAYTPVPDHENLRAADLTRFLDAFMSYAAWPLIGYPVLACVFCAPWLVATLGTIARRAAPDPALLLISALGTWILVQVASLAYGRGASGEGPAWRYMDTFALGIVVNVIALRLLLARIPIRRARLHRALAIVAACWVALAAGALVLLAARHVGPHLLHRADQVRDWARHCGSYLQRTDSIPAGELSSRSVPYHDLEQLVRFLDDPDLQAALPSDARDLLWRAEGISERPDLRQRRASVLLASGVVLVLIGLCSAGSDRPTHASRLPGDPRPLNYSSDL